MHIGTIQVIHTNFARLYKDLSKAASHALTFGSYYRPFTDFLLACEGASVHWYGKKGVSKNRKLGHVTIVGQSAEETLQRLSQIDSDAAERLNK